MQVIKNKGKEGKKAKMKGVRAGQMHGKHKI